MEMGGSRCKREGKMRAKHKIYRSPDDAASCKSKVDICSKARTESSKIKGHTVTNHLLTLLQSLMPGEFQEQISILMVSPVYSTKPMVHFPILEFVLVTPCYDYVVDLQHHATQLSSKHQLLSFAD